MPKIIFLFSFFILASSALAQSTAFFEADNELIQYTGRIDFSDPKRPRFWTAGVYIQAKFKGTSCGIIINDEMLWGESHNYIAVVIDDQAPARIKMTGKSDTLKVADGLADGEHTITIFKNTEALIGYLEFVGFNCEALLPMPPKPERKIEFIGNSITSGMGNDLTIPCGTAKWYDQHSAYFAYGPILARKFNAQYHLTSESGIGLIHSCCDKPFTMPRIFDKVSLSKDSLTWDFSRYQPDLVTVCLGQNDGVQDSLKFTAAYVDFIGKLREFYPKAQIVCLTSPMANARLRGVLQRYLTGIVRYVKKKGDKKVDKFFFSRSFNNGCGGHPDLKDHEIIAQELAAFIEKKMKWK